MRAKSETRQHGMSAPANIHGQGRSPIRTQEATKHHTGPSQPHHTPHHTPVRRTVRPVDGQTRAKRTLGRVSTRKRVRSPYSEPETIARGKWSETHAERDRGHGAATGGRTRPTHVCALADKTLTTSPRSARTKSSGARDTWKPQAHAPHTITR